MLREATLRIVLTVVAAAGLGLAVALATVLPATPAWPRPGPAMANPGNSITSPDTGGPDDVGEYTSLALDSSGNPVVSYYDWTHHDLKVLHCNDPNCAGDDESITAPDTGVDVGRDTSLELDGAGRPVVSYRDYYNGNLKVMHCNDVNCSGGDESVTSPDTGGSWTSLALDSSGYPVVSYNDPSVSGYLKLMHCDDANCDGVGESMASFDVGNSTSLALDSSGDPVVSYHGSVSVMHCNDPNCADGGDTITSPDTVGDVGWYTSLALDSSGYPVVSYYDWSNGNLKVLHCNDPNCSGGDESITSPDTGGSDDVGQFTSLALDGSGHPVVSYYDVTHGNLKVLHCNDPNCAGGDESITAPDTGGSDDVGWHTSLALDGSGNPVVSYYDDTHGDLKLLHCVDPNCTGFEPTPTPMPTATPTPTVATPNITIAGPGAPVPVGNNFDVEVSIDSGATAFSTYQVDVDVPTGLSYISGTHEAMGTFPFCFSYPAGPIAGPVQINTSCGHGPPDSAFTGLVETVTLRCDSGGAFPLNLVDLGEDAIFGSTLVGQSGTIPTNTTPDGQESVTCGAGPTDTPMPTATFTPTPTYTPTPTITPTPVPGLYVVDSIGDDGDDFPGNLMCNDGSGHCTLRAAIDEANADSMPSTINFDYQIFSPIAPGTIVLGSALPVLSAGNDTIDGPFGAIIVDGVDRSFNCFDITSSGNAIRGLEIYRCATGILLHEGASSNTIGGTASLERNVISDNGSAGVWMEGDGTDHNDVIGNYIGTDRTGMLPLGNGQTDLYAAGVGIGYGAEYNVIGGSGEGQGNVISGNGWGGVAISGASYNEVIGNYIGTNWAGDLALGNVERGMGINGAGIGLPAVGNVIRDNVISGNGTNGIDIWSANTTGNTVTGNLIGTKASGMAALGNVGMGIIVGGGAHDNTICGTTPDERNVISANDVGIAINEYDGTPHDIEVIGNYIGTDVNGTGPLGNVHEGVVIAYSPDNIIGGLSLGEWNVISANGGSGVAINGDTSTGNAVEANYIGTNDSGDDLGNGGPGVGINNASDNTIQENTIAFNAGVGVGMIGDAEATQGNEITENYIYQNDGLGIDLGDDGITPNDPNAGDPDSGPNGFQNFPVLTSATSAMEESTTISGSFNSTPDTDFTLEFFYSDLYACDPSGNGEGENPLGSTVVHTNGSGHASFTVEFGFTVPWGEVITATATDPLGNTSEFSNCVTVTEPFALVSVDMQPGALSPGVQSEGPVDLAAVEEGGFGDENPDFGIDIFVQDIPAYGLGSFVIDLFYNSARVDATSITEGSFLANGGTYTCELEPALEPGRAWADCYFEGGDPAVGSGVLLNIQFDILPDPGSDDLSFTLEVESLLGPDEEPIAHSTADGVGDVVGIINHLAGAIGVCDFAGDGGQAQYALLCNPHGVFEVVKTDTLYVADTGDDPDTGNNAVRMIQPNSPNGIIDTVAGRGGGTCGGNEQNLFGDGCPATDAVLSGPWDVFVDVAGNLYIADEGHDLIRKVVPGADKVVDGDPDEIITTVAGGGSGCDGPPPPDPPYDGCLATEAILDGPRGVAVDEQGNIYIADSGHHRIRRVDFKTGIITTVAGTGFATGSIDVDGSGDPRDDLNDGHLAIDASLKSPSDVYMYGVEGDFIIADSANNRIRIVDAFSGNILTFAGSGFGGYGGDDGPATLAHLKGPLAVAVDTDDLLLPSVLIADTENHCIRQVNGRTSFITTVAGTCGTSGFEGDGGSATLAHLYLVGGVAVGSITGADSGNSTLRAIDQGSGEPRGKFSDLTCTFGSIGTVLFVVIGVLGPTLGRRRIRGLCLWMWAVLRPVARPGTSG
jgi:CSLREA domain-containing protein